MAQAFIAVVGFEVFLALCSHESGTLRQHEVLLVCYLVCP